MVDKNSKLTKRIQSEKTATNIINQAKKLFLEKGYHGTTVDDIALSIGLTKGALYWHFKGKESLLRRVIEEYETSFLDGLIQAIQTEGETKGRSKLEKIFRYNADFAYHNRELCAAFTTLAAELVGAHHGIEGEIKRIYKKYQTFLSESIQEAKEERTFKEQIDTDLAALTIMAFHDGILLHWFMNQERVDGARLAETFKKIMLDGMMV